MQHNMAGCNLMLLGETFSLLTHGCHRGIPQGIQGMSVRRLKLAASTAELDPPVQCCRGVMWAAIISLRNSFTPHERVPLA